MTERFMNEGCRLSRGGEEFKECGTHTGYCNALLCCRVGNDKTGWLPSVVREVKVQDWTIVASAQSLTFRFRFPADQQKGTRVM